MSSQTIKFEEKFYSSKYVILLNDIDVSKIVVSNKWKINETTCKFFIGYLSEDFIKPLCIILPQMGGFIKYFEGNTKNMSFITDDKDIDVKYSEVWDRVKKLLKIKFNTNPIRDRKYILAKLKIFNDVNKTAFSDNKIPQENNHYVGIASIDIDSVLEIDKKIYPQVYLEQCKCKLRKKKPCKFY